jgi:hypothetical protein
VKNALSLISRPIRTQFKILCLRISERIIGRRLSATKSVEQLINEIGLPSPPTLAKAQTIDVPFQTEYAKKDEKAAAVLWDLLRSR